MIELAINTGPISVFLIINLQVGLTTSTVSNRLDKDILLSRSKIQS